MIVTDILEQAPDVKTFYLSPEAGEHWVYTAGQFLTLDQRINGQSVRRSYSFSSCPDVDQQAAITVKRVDNGSVSRWLLDIVQVGTKLQLASPPSGIFTLPSEPINVEVIWLFAAGIGITPIFSLLKDILYHRTQRVVLIYSNSNPGSTVFLKEIEGLAIQFPERLSVVWLWSNSLDMLRARLSSASFNTILAPYWPKDRRKLLSFICGPRQYMWMVQLLLEQSGIPESNIRREVFQTRELSSVLLPQDKAPHTVTVSFSGQQVQFINRYPLSILDSALEAEIQLPYSCKTGQCGACTAVCTDGRVWMSYNEVLTENDLRSGRVLTCKGHAVGGDVHLVYQ
ncbi:MAG: iron-sulfur cluster-binding domain-containing protein [Bacteroidetes bacterium]|nr:iron-sulfur cluster-binding domain-containing protein [Bacteroidota bacterium]